jgi:GTPase SAR1 family protein
MVGGKGVGKTSITRRYTQDLFSKTYVPTIGMLLFPAARQLQREGGREGGGQ